MKIKYREKVSKLYIIAFVIVFLIVTIPLLELSLKNRDNQIVIIITCSWIIISLLVFLVHFKRLSCVILKDDELLASTRSYQKDSLDVKKLVVITNGKIHIKYESIEKVLIDDEIYIKYSGLKQDIVLNPKKKEEFIDELKQKLYKVKNEVEFEYSNINLDNYIKYKDIKLCNTPFRIVVGIFFLFPLAAGVLYFINGSYSFLAITSIVVLLFYSVTTMYSNFIYITKDSLIIETKFLDVNIDKEIIPFSDIKKVTKQNNNSYVAKIKVEKEELFYTLNKRDQFVDELELKIKEYNDLKK